MTTAGVPASLSLAIDIPDGYVGLPLDDIDRAIARTESIFAQIGPGTVSSAAPTVLQALRVLLTRIARLNAAYCGLGRHSASDGRLISSNLIVSLNEYGGRGNPRLTLAEVLTGRCGGGETFNNVELIEVAGKPVLMLDRVRTLPTPELPGRTPELDQQVYQLEAVVPASDGSAIAVIEFSTPFVEYGEDFLPMIIAMAASVDITTSARRSDPRSSLDL
ncbi:hypothetical protein [Nocardia brasiliensis]|uniref:hypothetical protein n=1 Tax=Nocardia brasiliensis TaxID=37326 RepID=UPI00366B7622